MPTRTFRLFVSSTFEDLVAERNALNEYVYPELRNFCAEHGSVFQPIDLRWGVSEEAGVDQRAMEICLAEIRRCQLVTPRPNFLILLGNRYGWCPPPLVIPKSELDEIKEHVTDEDRHLLDWYMLDRNAAPLEYRLRSRDDPPKSAEGSGFADAEKWGPVEGRLQAALAGATQEMDLDDERRSAYVSSATEQEIRQGALGPGGAEDRAICLFREISGAPQGQYVDADQRPLQKLKAKLREKLPSSSVKEYEVHWADPRPTDHHLDRLVQDAAELLTAKIEREMANPSPQLQVPADTPGLAAEEDLDAEGEEHRRFAVERARVFEGRESALTDISQYLDGENPHPFVIHGEGGVGKSTLLAEAAIRAQNRGAEVVYRFIGATPNSSSGRSLLASLSRELARRVDEDEGGIPDDFQRLSWELEKRLERCGQARPVFLFVDSLDQLSPADGARRLDWIPDALPDGVRLVLSTRPGDTLDPLLEVGATQLELGGLNRGEGEQLLGRWLELAGRGLQPAQRDGVLDRFVESGGNALWLRLAFEELRLWRGREDPRSLSAGTRPIIASNTYPRLALEENHGDVLVSRVLGYLAATRYGLSEDELVGLLNSDPVVYRWFLVNAHHLPPDVRRAAARVHGADEESEDATDWLNELRNDSSRRGELDRFLADAISTDDGLQLPAVIWSRLFADLSPYLSERSSEGVPLVDFHHRELDEVAASLYLSEGAAKPCQLRLADYFRRQVDPDGDGSWRGSSVRGLSEFPYHLAMGADGDDGRWRQLRDVLTDFRFLERKSAEVGAIASEQGHVIAYTGVFRLQDDFELALEMIPQGSAGAELRPNLEAFEGALANEAHNLATWPEIVFQQLHNRLQWTDGLVARLETERERRRGWPWIQTRNPPREGPAFLRVVAHHDHVDDLACSAEGARICSVGVDPPFRLSHAATGAEIRELPDEAQVRGLACTFGVDGRQIYVGTDLGALAYFDGVSGVADGDEQQVKRGEINLVLASRDGNRFCSASDDGTVVVRDVETRAEIAVFEGHTDRVNALAFSPDAERIVSAAGRYLDAGIATDLRLWDAESGAELAALDGHRGDVNTVAFSPDGTRICSAGADQALRLWDGETGAELGILQGHEARVLACEFGHDGEQVCSCSEDGTLRLWNLASPAEPAVLYGHEATVNDVAYGVDGTRICSASDDGTLRVWDSQTGVELGVLRGHSGGVTICTFCGEGPLVCSAGIDGTVRLWDISPKKLSAPDQPDDARGFEGHVTGLNAVRFSPDGNGICSASDDQTVRLWDSGAGTELTVFREHTRPVQDCVFAPNGSWICSVDNGGILRVWDAMSGTEAAVLEAADEHGSAEACAISPDGRWICSGDDDGILRLWDTEEGGEPQLLEGHSDDISAVAFSPDGRRLCSASWDETVRIWDVQTCAELEILRGHTRPVHQVTFSPDGTQICSAGADNTVRLWAVPPDSGPNRGTEPRALLGHEIAVLDCALSPDGRLICSAGMDNTLRIWDAATGSEVAAFDGPSEEPHTWPRACAFSPDGTQICAAWVDGTLRLVDAQTGTELSLFTGHSAAVTSCAFSPNGKRVCSASVDSSLRVWDLDTGGETTVLDGRTELQDCVYSPDGSRICAAGDDGAVRLWDAETGAVLTTLYGHAGSVNAVAFSPDGSQICSAGFDDETLRLWDAGTGAELAIFEGHRSSFSDCAFSPNGNQICSADAEGTVRLWDARTGGELGALKHSDAVNACEFSPDGTLICSASDDPGVWLWDAEVRESVVLQGHSAAVRGCVFTPDGHWLCSISEDRTLRLWDARTGESAALLPVPRHSECVAVHPRLPLVAWSESADIHLVDLIGIDSPT